jgi:hypothetical protein
MICLLNINFFPAVMEHCLDYTRITDGNMNRKFAFLYPHFGICLHGEILWCGYSTLIHVKCQCTKDLHNYNCDGHRNWLCYIIFVRWHVLNANLKKLWNFDDFCIFGDGFSGGAFFAIDENHLILFSKNYMLLFFIFYFWVQEVFNNTSNKS